MKILLGISSGIAAYKIIDLAKDLIASGNEVRIILTPSASKMLPIKSIEEKLPGTKVYLELFDKDFDYEEILETREVEHIELSKWADIICVAPGTANTIAKIASGFADNLLTTTLLATEKPILLCPSMNTNMWNNRATQENLIKVKNHGIEILAPESGSLACGDNGVGRLPDIKVIKNKIEEILSRSTELKGKKIIVTAGGTQEKIDAVRVITNSSSGKMGIAIAEECKKRGGEVVLIRTKTSVQPNINIDKEIVINTGEEMLSAIKVEIESSDYIFHVAAVSDFKVESVLEGKISSKNKITLDLVPNLKIIDAVKKLNPQIKLIGFKAESNLSEEDLVFKAQQLLQRANADMIVANDIGKNEVFGSDENEIIIVTKNKVPIKFSLTSKTAIAANVVDAVIEI